MDGEWSDLRGREEDMSTMMMMTIMKTMMTMMIMTTYLLLEE